jgi:tetratricopeptide (TPR) repeat protein
MTKDQRKVCFVVMGFGKKTDPESGRTLDLDATYDAIIKPVVESLGFRCIRADEILHSGSIDKEMYELLLRADLVIADISTGNVNAVYELGVRHALRPNSTVIIKEIDGKTHFDLSHVNTISYKHLGEDIGVKEADRARKELCNLIPEIMKSSKPDSPVYTYLPKLQKPQLSDEEYEELLDETEAAQDYLASLMQTGESAQKASNHAAAVTAFKKAATLKRGEPYILQQLALATYKSEIPSKQEALMAGLKILNELDPINSNDPETLGIAGAINKRLWILSKEKLYLDTAIIYYGRGFEIRRDYYNGENLALCYDYRASVQSELLEEFYDHISAIKVRKIVVLLLTDLKNNDVFIDRTDRLWIYASLANCLFGLQKREEGMIYENAFLKEKPAEWQSQTYFNGKYEVSRFANPFIDLYNRN